MEVFLKIRFCRQDELGPQIRDLASQMSLSPDSRWADGRNCIATTDLVVLGGLELSLGCIRMVLIDLSNTWRTIFFYRR